jgi:NIPSNAP protein
MESGVILAFQTTCLTPHRFGAYLEAYGREGWPIERAVFGECAGSYFVEIGPQQRLIQIWPHSDAAEWRRWRAERAAHPDWRAFRAAHDESIVSESDRLFEPAPFMPVRNFTTADDFVEMRVYRARTGALDRFLALYAREGLPIQVRHLGHCIGYFRSVDGRVDEVLHLWGYADLNDRIRRREALFADPGFKAFLVQGVPHFSRQENLILRPTAFWRASRDPSH